MRPHQILLAGAVFACLGAGAAAADCAAEIATLRDDAEAATAEPLLPIEDGGEGGGEVADLTTPPQGAEGEPLDGTDNPTAVEAAEVLIDVDRDEAIARAEAALEAGDEAACMQAVEEARSL